MAHRLKPDEVDEFLAELAAVIEPVDLHFRWRPQSKDANNEMLIEAAINGAADALVTYNSADFKAAGERFGISILSPSELLKRVNR